ncbi:hypothetical protein MKQ68_09855 [Chitinophaga horti]|uniref:RHS repeat-associated core domain-containing protein n=1 Tax=Chitinophaga horti TaxID=2920382 RepID=A0ABY6J7V0_9BACT|nr:hypothetical protein [Chitinophaga horti]UYQ95401.1 hypothetical protein MKQ68_09855 [Chitinophaga horti]
MMTRKKLQRQLDELLGGLTVIMMADGLKIRRKRGPKRDQVLKSPRFAASRASLADFVSASKAGKLLRNSFGQSLAHVSEKGMHNRLTSLMCKVIKADETNVTGSRTVRNGDPRLLRGFKFNSKTSLDKISYQTTVDRQSGRITISISSFDPKLQLGVPPGATHFVLHGSASGIDFESGNYANAYTEHAAVPVDLSQTGDIRLTMQLPAGMTAPTFVVFCVYFLEETGGVLLPLTRKSTNALVLVGVDNEQVVAAPTVRLRALPWRGEISGKAVARKVRDVVQMNNGKYAICGLFNNNPAGRDFLIASLNNSGDLRWIRRYGTDNTAEQSVSLIEEGDNLVVSGYGRLSSTTRNTGMVFKVNKFDGYLVEAKKFDVGTNNDHVFGKVIPTPGGYKVSFMTTVPPYSDCGIAGMMDITSAGFVLSTKMFDELPGTLAASPAAFHLTADGGYIAVIQTASNKFYMRKVNAAGQLVWTKAADLGGYLKVDDFVLNPDGNLTVGGTKMSSAFLMHAGASGSTGCDDAPLARTMSNVSTLMTPFTLSESYRYKGDTTGRPVGGPEARAVYPVGDNSPVGDNLYIRYLSFTPLNVSVTRSSLSCGARDVCSTEYVGPLLCGIKKPVFESSLTPIDNCSDNGQFIASNASRLYQAYRENALNKFEADYLESSLKAAERETFTVGYEMSEYHYTLYYYDQAGNLVKTVPPSGVVVDRSNSWLQQVAAARANGTALPAAHGFQTRYRYNILNALTSQLTPDAGTSYFWYDRLGRLSLSQNNKQLDANHYSYTKYDVLGRISEIGELTSGTAMTQLLSRDPAALSGWMNTAANSRRDITLTHYDTPYEGSGPVLFPKNLRNRVAWTAVYNSAADATHLFTAASFYSYDIHGNVGTIWQAYKKADAVHDLLTSTDYDYDLISGKVNKVSYQPGLKDAFYHRYQYDADNRLVNVETSRDDLHWENEAYYKYYKHGPLARIILGQQQVQGIDYAYTLQGWLKGVNSTTLTPDFDMSGDGSNNSFIAKDAFGYALHYYGAADYTPVKSSVKPFADLFSAGTHFKPLYNGNIGAMSVHLPAVGEPLLYAYKYDVLNRISGMQTLRSLNTTTNSWTGQAVDDFKEAVTYDGNGNIKTYSRNGNNTFSGQPLAMDNMTYHYTPGTNKLTHVTDPVPAGNYGSDIDEQTAGNYSYDKIGNLISDSKEGITNIEWNIYGKIKSITKPTGTIHYAYDAAGNRIRKETAGVYTWYVRDATGNVLSVYTQHDNSVNNGHLSLTESHLYGSSRLGMATSAIDMEEEAPEPPLLAGNISNKNTIFNRGKKLFELSNHLGNVMAVVTDRPVGVSDNQSTVSRYAPEITNAQDYYPFGMLMPGRTMRQIAGGQAVGSTMLNGHNVPESLLLRSRDASKPAEYVASREVVFEDGFESGMADEFVASIADAGYGGSGSGAAGVFGVGGYRYGFNGQEKSDEIKGEGNSYTAEFWEYDSRLARRWNIDPVVKHYESPYASLGNNPVNYSDPDGADTAKAISKSQLVDAIKVASAEVKNVMKNNLKASSDDVSGRLLDASAKYLEINQQDMSYNGFAEFKILVDQYYKGLLEVARNSNAGFLEFDKNVINNASLSPAIIENATIDKINTSINNLLGIYRSGANAALIATADMPFIPIAVRRAPAPSVRVPLTPKPIIRNVDDVWLILNSWSSKALLKFRRFWVHQRDGKQCLCYTVQKQAKAGRYGN